MRDGHLFSAYLMTPLAATMIGLLMHNWWVEELGIENWSNPSRPFMECSALNCPSLIQKACTGCHNGGPFVDAQLVG